MGALLVIGSAILGGLALKRIFAAPAVRSSMPSKSIDKMVTINGRPTYLHAPMEASRIVVFFHGFGSSVASRGPVLAKTLDGQPVALVMPQLGPKSEPGDLATAFPAYLAAVRQALGLPTGAVDGAAHSGGYQALAAAYRQTPFRALGLLDAFYGQYETFLAAAKTGHCLIDIYGPTTATLSKQLGVEVGSLVNVKIFPTGFAHDTIPETYFANMVKAFDGCRPMTVT